MSRQIERAIARGEYADFCRTWSRERRMSADGPHVPRPTFKEWLERFRNFRHAPHKDVKMPVILDKQSDPWKDDA
jgi:hypothetical protein